LKARRGRSDWAKVEATTEADLARVDRDDPDLHGVEDIDWSKAEVVLPGTKTAISIRLDADLLDFFKAAGPGYQSRINAVLRAYMKAYRHT
jgi:uncharacterized protein (DUF4415 family)